MHGKRIHIWPPGVQLSGGGLALVGTFGPALGLIIPHPVRVGLAIVGLALLAAPLVMHLATNAREIIWRKSTQIRAPIEGTETQTSRAYLYALSQLFVVNDTNSAVTLRFKPTGHDRSAEIVLLLLYGYRELLNVHEVRSSELKMVVDYDLLDATHSSLLAGQYAKNLRSSLAAMVQDKLPGKVVVSGLNRVADGFMSLTEDGIAAAKRRADELIAQAD